jgi:hypothetical protein
MRELAPTSGRPWLASTICILFTSPCIYHALIIQTDIDHYLHNAKTPFPLPFPSVQITELILHLNIRLLPLLGSSLFLPKVFEQVATLEILIRMHDRLELCSTPRAVFFNFLDLLLVCIFENPLYRQRSSSGAAVPGNASKRISTEKKNTYRLQAI